MSRFLRQGGAFEFAHATGLKFLLRCCFLNVRTAGSLRMCIRTEASGQCGLPFRARPQSLLGPPVPRLYERRRENARPGPVGAKLRSSLTARHRYRTGLFVPPAPNPQLALWVAFLGRFAAWSVRAWRLGLPQRPKPGREIRAIAARLEEAAVLRATATTGAEAHADSICFTRPWKGRSFTVMHTLLVFPQPLAGGGHNSGNVVFGRIP